MVREALRLRRNDKQGAALRPTDNVPVTQWDSALRSDYVYIDAPLGVEEKFLNTDNIGYDSADVRFSPAAVLANNPYTPYGTPDAYSIVRSPAGVPVTNLDGIQVARFDFTVKITIALLSLTSNVVTITTVQPHGYTVGQSVQVQFTVPADQTAYGGNFTIIAVPTSTTFTYAKTHANVASTGILGTTLVYGLGASPLPADQSVRVVDTGLLPGQFYYYGLFARYNFTGNTYWFRISNSEILTPFPFGCADKIWSLIPEYYRRLDQEQVGQYQQSGVLRRFIDTIGYECDLQRTWNSTVGDLWDVGRINARLLVQLGLLLGHGIGEAAVGDKRYRTLLANLMYLRKFRGTKDGIEGWLAAITGYKILSYEGKNLMLSNDATEFRGSLGPLADTTQSVLTIFTVTNKALTSNVATLTTGSPHGFIVGEGITIQNVDATFNGNIVVTAVSSTTFSYSKTAANVTSVAVPVASPMPIAFANTYGAITRITSAGESGGPPSGAFYARYTQVAFGGYEGHMRYGSTAGGFGTSVQTSAIPVTAGHSYRFSAFVISSAGSLNYLTRIEWYDVAGNLLNVTTDSAIVALTTWSQLSSNWLTAPAGAAFAIPSGVLSNMGASGTYGMWKTMFTDRAWIPTGQPALYVDPPTSYESARMVHVSLYPQRTNYAINSDFSQQPGSFPAQGWTATDPATYDTLPFAYATYTAIFNVTVSNKALTSNVATLTTTTAHGLVVGNIITVSGVDATFNGTFTITTVPTSTTFTYAKTATNVTSVASGGNVTAAPENSYDDLLAGYDTLSSSTVLNFNSGGVPYYVPGFMQIVPVGAPYVARASSAFFPVVSRAPYSARIMMSPITGAANIRLRFRWFTASNAGAEIVGSDQAGPLAVIAQNGNNDSLVAVSTPVFVLNATPPVGALFGRVVIECSSPTNSTYNVFVSMALIEDAAIPGAYFDGNTTEGAIGDFRFTGTAGQSFSAYYGNFNAVMNGLASADRLHSVMPTLVPPDRDFMIHSVANSLL